MCGISITSIKYLDLLAHLDKQAKIYQDKEIQQLSEPLPYYGRELPF